MTDASAPLLARDPDPRVRAAAAETLSDADGSPMALKARMAALRDNHPDIVIAAIDSFEWSGDSTVAAEFTFLLNDPRPDVKERAADAIEWLKDE